MVIEARILTRCCYENLFMIVALTEQGNAFVKKMILDHKTRRRLHGEFLMKYTVGENHDLRAFLHTLEKSKGQELNPRSVSKGSSLERGYAYYAELSADAAHPGLDALDRYLDYTTSHVNANPSVDDKELRRTVNLACEAMFGMGVHVNALLDLADDPELIRLIEMMGHRSALETG